MKFSSKVIPLILLFFFANDVLAQKIIKAKKVTTHNGLVCYVKKLTPVTGRVSEEFQNIKQLKSETDYIDGKKEGLYKEWDKKGKLKINVNYINGLKDGLCKEWYHNGQISKEQHYKDGKKDGLCNEWSYDGQIIKEQHYKDGKKDGLHKVWRENGQIKSEINYLDDKIDGLCKRWSENSGKLTENRNYKNGLPVEVSAYEIEFKGSDYLSELCYYKNKSILFTGRVSEKFLNIKQLKSETDYIDGKKDGLHKVWFENGNLRAQGNYKEGKRVGLHKTWSKNGHLFFEGNYNEGKEVGVRKFWHENGQLYGEENYNDGMKVGLWKEWYENGQIKKEENYNDGMEVGLWKEWYENGQIKKEKNYNDYTEKEWYENGKVKPKTYTFDEANRFMKSRCRKTNHTILKTHSYTFEGTVVYCFLTCNSDMLDPYKRVAPKNQSVCISMISEKKLEVIAADCGSQDRKLRDWENLF